MLNDPGEQDHRRRPLFVFQPDRRRSEQQHAAPDVPEVSREHRAVDAKRRDVALHVARMKELLVQRRLAVVVEARLTSGLDLPQRVLPIVLVAEPHPGRLGLDYLERDGAMPFVPVQEFLRAWFLRRRWKPAPTHVMVHHRPQPAVPADLLEERGRVRPRIDPADPERIRRPALEITPNQLGDDQLAMTRQRHDVAIVGHRVAREHELAGLAMDRHRHETDHPSPRGDDENVRVVRLLVAAVPRHAPSRGLIQARQGIFVHHAAPFVEEAARQLRLERPQVAHGVGLRLVSRRVVQSDAGIHGHGGGGHHRVAVTVKWYRVL